MMLLLLRTYPVVAQDTLVGLMGIYSSTKTENVKATAASTLSRMLRSSPGMLSGVLERWGRPLLLTGGLASTVLVAVRLLWL